MVSSRLSSRLSDMIRGLGAHFPELVRWRREMHMYPELSFEEEQTPARISAYLRDIGLEVRTGVGGRGVVARLEGDQPGPTVAIRADFDALPIQDEKQVPYKSRVPGKMHACGHDVHTASLLGTARVLSKHRQHLKGNVVFIHQHAEEIIPGGAKSMIEDGCLDGVDVIYGAHVWSMLPYGTVGYRESECMSSADEFAIEITGRGGHAAQPHFCVDPLVTGTQLIGALQQIVSRRVDPLKSAVLTVGSFHSGDSFNVIPEKARMEGTVRTFDGQVRDDIERSIEAITAGTCEQAGATYQLEYRRGYPPVCNSVQQTEHVRKCAQAIFKAQNVHRMEPLMLAEDFAYYLQHVPGCFFFVGGGNPDIAATYPHHHARFDVDERAMLSAGQLFLTLVMHEMYGDDLELANVQAPEPIAPVQPASTT